MNKAIKPNNTLFLIKQLKIILKLNAKIIKNFPLKAILYKKIVIFSPVTMELRKFAPKLRNL